MIKKYKNVQGFTLIELMVAVAVFAVVMVLAAGAYINIIALSQKANAISTAMDSTSSVLEYMTREIRTGTEYGCNTTPNSTTATAGNDCTLAQGGGSAFTVLDQGGTTVTFALSNGGICESTDAAPSSPCSANILTDPSIHINSMTFYAVGTKPYSDPSQDTTPPHVTIVIVGYVIAGKAQLPFTIETGATARNVDL